MFKTGVDKGHTYSLFNLGWCYENGLGGLDVDIKQARVCYENAAAKSNIYKSFLARLDGVPAGDPDENPDIEWLEKFAARGRTMDIVLLGWACEKVCRVVSAANLTNKRVGNWRQTGRLTSFRTVQAGCRTKISMGTATCTSSRCVNERRDNFCLKTALRVSSICFAKLPRCGRREKRRATAVTWQNIKS